MLTLTEKLGDLKLPEVILPKFSLTAEELGRGNLISIKNASIGYKENELFLENINLSLPAKERMAIAGDNGSGKTTLVKAILGDPAVIKTGDWHIPKKEDIGYLDQHYANLNPDMTVLESLSSVATNWSQTEIRRHLSDFLFRGDEAVNMLVKHLSGGEKARLSLSIIAAVTPKLLILDEVTNNIDLETKDHIAQVLNQYPGSILIISHEEDFLEAIGVERVYQT